jgi:hypothetical protein
MADTTTAVPGAGPRSAGCFLCTTALPLLRGLMSNPAADHFRNAQLEILKGIRSLLDSQIAWFSRTDEPKGTRVAVE